MKQPEYTIKTPMIEDIVDNMKCCGNCSYYFMGLNSKNEFILGCAVDQGI
jgi:hypothetical protein